MFKFNNLKFFCKRKLLEAELEAVGIRLNQKKPNIYWKRKKTGGLTINSMVKLTKMTERLAAAILSDYSL
jgi:ribosome-interacting GTPase 1